MIEAHLKKLKSKAGIPIIGLVLLVIVFGVVAILQFTKPYAIATDGTKIEEPWVVKIGEKESFIVASEKEGKEVIEKIKTAYYPEQAAAKAATLEPEVTVVEKELDRGDKAPKVVEPEAAAKAVVAANESETPLLKVMTTEQVSKTEKIDYKVKYKDTKALYKGEEKVAVKGKKGKKTITSQVIRENGKVIATTIVATSVEKKPVAKVVKKGTKTQTAAAASQVVSRGGVAMGRGAGSDVVNYAMQFLGNPYVYGGSSLTNGTDCSGFTMSVYAHFGIGLPHSSSAQRSCGKGVPYSEAQPGDIICYSGHVGIYIGGGKIVHASTPRTGIIVGSATYKPIITVRRIVE